MTSLSQQLLVSKIPIQADTKNTLDEVFKKDGAKSTVVVTSIEPSVRYEKDATRSKGGANVTEAGTPGTRTVTTTYTVNPTDG